MVDRIEVAKANAIQRRIEILKQMSELRGELSRVNRFLEAYVVFEKGITGDEARIQLKRVRSGNPHRDVVAKAAVEILLAHGKPMKTEELLEALDQSRITVIGKNPVSTLNTMLWRSQRLILRLPKLGYWPVGVDVPVVLS